RGRAPARSARSSPSISTIPTATRSKSRPTEPDLLRRFAERVDDLRGGRQIDLRGVLIALDRVDSPVLRQEVLDFREQRLVELALELARPGLLLRPLPAPLAEYRQTLLGRAAGDDVPCAVLFGGHSHDRHHPGPGRVDLELMGRCDGRREHAAHRIAVDNARICRIETVSL